MSYPPPVDHRAPYRPYDPYASPPGSPTGWDQPGTPVSGYPPQPGYPPPAYAAQPGHPQPGYPQPGYPQPGYPPPGYPPARTNVMAILSLVLLLFFAPASIVLGHIAKKQIRQTGEQGDGLATAGLVVGYLITAAYVLLWVVWAVLVF
ncbi:DUF4190 domain-containing protein [Polymorphospora rubra]|uniref:DUF4190 domain-containing protein n=1 Tax=Polymorphospora rubra TaxID=338584 RepID=A0A810N3C0_9ACTN|nr:DUF4190 domain-containing protein [Polymorphospora rubra]BCJ66213.1 hypothetical protein Prubr_32340 [Polymorphospora rubra]